MLLGIFSNSTLHRVISTNKNAAQFYAESMIHVLELQYLGVEKVDAIRYFFLIRNEDQKKIIQTQRNIFLKKLDQIHDESKDQESIEFYQEIRKIENIYNHLFLSISLKGIKKFTSDEIEEAISTLIPYRDQLKEKIADFANFKKNQLGKARLESIEESKKAEKLFFITTLLLISLWIIVSIILIRSYSALKKSDSQKRKALSDLNESILRFKDLVNHLDHSIVWEATTNPFKLHFVSERSRIIFGVEAQEMIDDSNAIFRNIHPEDVSKLKNCIQEASHSTKDIRCDHRVLLPDDGLRWIQTRVHFRRGNKGTQTLYGLSLEMTANKNIELNLQRALKEVEQYKYALDSSSIVLTTDANGNIIRVNDQFCLVSKYSRDELIGIQYKILCSGIHPETFYKELNDTLFQGKLWRSESQIRAKDGTIIWVDAIIVPFMDEEGKPWRFMGILNDISLKKNVGTERERLITDLQLEKEARLKFVNTLTHDLRTPLTAAKIAAQMIVMKKEDQEKVIELSFKIKNAINRTDNMIQDLLDADRIRAGQPLILKTEYAELKSIISEAIEEQSLIHGNRFILKTNGPLYGFWDKTGIRRMADNLLSNAIKYGLPDEKIIISIGKEDEWGIFSVFNKGEKLSQDEVNSLFSHYHRLKRAIDGQIKGWGIGLTLVKGIAEAHGGRVEVQTNKEGITFKVFLKTVQNHLSENAPRDIISS